MADASPSNPKRDTHRPNLSKSWAEEIWTVTLAAPVVLAFVPGLNQTEPDAFQILSHAPLWYQSAVGASIVFAFGSRAYQGARLLLSHRSSPHPVPPAAIVVAHP